MRVLRRPLETREIPAGDELLKFEAPILPYWGKAFAGAAEELVGKIRRAETREFRQPLLLVRSCATAFDLNRSHEPDGGEVVFGSTLPGLGETALAGEAISFAGINGSMGTGASRTSAASGSEFMCV